MVIIVEGIDRIGKSTLCNKLSGKFKIPIFRHSGTIPYYKMTNEQETDKILNLIQLISITNSSVIFDRFYITDFVYGIIERNYDHEKALFNFELIEFELQNLINDIHLVLMQPTDIMSSSFQHRKNLSLYNTCFKDRFIESNIKHKYEINYNQIDDLVDDLVKNINIEGVK